jgi:O-antigen ligase
MTVLGMVRYRKIYIGLILALLVLFLLIPSLNQKFLKRLEPDTSLYGRFSLNELSLYLFSQKPFLGSGFGTYQLFSAKFIEELGSGYGRGMGVAPHNEYLKFLCETGAVGFLAFIFLLYSLLRLGYRTFKSKAVTLKSEGSILLAVLTGILVYSLTDSGFSYGGIFLWTLIGLVEAKSHLTIENEKRRT